MKREPVNSKSVVSVGYDAETQELEVEWPSGIYRYAGVSEETYAELQAAESIGKFILARIKPGRQWARVDNRDGKT